LDNSTTHPFLKKKRRRLFNGFVTTV